MRDERADARGCWLGILLIVGAFVIGAGVAIGGYTLLFGLLCRACA